jgi:linoleate 10R-lipoxygenase
MVLCSRVCTETCVGSQQVAEQLYQHIDNLELYVRPSVFSWKSWADSVVLQVGLMCEESKQPGDGAGLCPGYTISRAILTDAVCLTRGDRFLTTDLTREHFYLSALIYDINLLLSATNLTSWGYQDCAREGNNGSMGGNVCKLLFRNLPQYYPERSAYAQYVLDISPAI